jgi:hypothetical protein
MGAPTPANKVDVFWADSLGGFDLGVKLNYGDNHPNDPTNAVTTSSNNGLNVNNINTAQALGIDLGVGFKSAFFSQMNFHAGYSLGNFQDQQTFSNGPTISSNGGKDNGIYTLTAGTLLQHDFTPDNSVRFFGDWNANQFDAKDAVQDSPDKDYNDLNSTNYSASSNFNEMVATLGLGANHKFANGKSLVTSGFLVSYWSAKQTASEDDKPLNETTAGSYKSEEDTTIWDLSWETGIEVKATDWLTLRAGIEKSILNNTDTKLTQTNPTNGTTTSEDSGDANALNSVQFNMGFGINVADFALNTVVSAGSLETTLGSVEPGNGILFNTGTSTSPSPIVTVIEADLSHPL